MSTQLKKPKSRTPTQAPKSTRSDDIEQLLARMTPERRALLERILARREAMKPVDFDIVEALRELRGYG